MKKIISIFIFSLTFTLTSAQENFEVSTLRIGPFKVFMPKVDAEKIAGTKLTNSDGEKKNSVKYNGEIIQIDLFDNYINEANLSVPSITYMTTTSKKFKTKSGIGVGSTRDDLINTYRNYPNFSVRPDWDSNGKPIKDSGYFNIEDSQAGTLLSFKFVNNIVTEISVYLNEGC
ncbi:hypothetical protein J2795_004576 [Chryseobacterium bernardetii]|uniref:Uncharacterized protein n=2 Tax=Chryseobacterium TaxID=59732 RepID=A0A543E9V7_9FLAO|nr:MULTISPECIES: hypothetical protein [Chryseobacterium]MDR6371892.1 hypothetical protein [Chryseobacterium vietnamense]MDR6443824.1 hypothetical protein [Chryseobacterium bernardetii]TQM18382.1 hypothetical protein FB551_4164 [Chryseobacterium aquifrigidense]